MKMDFAKGRNITRRQCYSATEYKEAKANISIGSNKIERFLDGSTYVTIKFKPETILDDLAVMILEKSPTTSSNRYLLSINSEATLSNFMSNDIFQYDSGLTLKNRVNYAYDGDSASCKHYVSDSIHLNEISSIDPITLGVNTISDSTMKVYYGPQLIFLNENIDFESYTYLNYVSNTYSVSGTGVLKCAVSFDNGISWKRHVSGETWDTIDIFDKNNFKTYGMPLNSVGLSNKIYLKAGVLNSKTIKLAYIMDLGGFDGVSKLTQILINGVSAESTVILSPSYINISWNDVTKEMSVRPTKSGSFIINCNGEVI